MPAPVVVLRPSAVDGMIADIVGTVAKEVPDEGRLGVCRPKSGEECGSLWLNLHMAPVEPFGLVT